MKKKTMKKRDLEQMFYRELIEDNQLNYLLGGDGDGGQTAPPDPWKP